MWLAPGQIGREETVAAIQLATIVLASALLGTVLGVGGEELGEDNEARPEVVDAHRMPCRNAVVDHREEVTRPELQVRLANFTNIRKQFVLVDFR